MGHINNIPTNICRIQAYDPILCGYFCIRFIDYMLNNKRLIDFTKLFSLNNCKKNDETIPEYF